MFEPKLSYSPQIINTLAAIERLYGQILAEKLIPSLSLKLAQENQVLATHHSTSIEGNPLLVRDVTNIVLGDQIPTTKSEKEVKSYFAVLGSLVELFNLRAPITTKLTLELHKKLMANLEGKDAGHFRTGSVFVGRKTKTEISVKHNPPYHTQIQIEHALAELYAWLNEPNTVHPVIKAGILHHQFAYLHPFYDGNGRLARILTTYFLLLKGYEVTKYFILDDYYDIDRQLYSDKLHSADSGDETVWLEYFLEGIANSLQAALARIRELTAGGLDKLSGEKRVLVTPREEEVLEIVLAKTAVKSSALEESFGVSRQQAHALLSSLVGKGILQKFGSTKNSYYKLLKS